MWQQIKTNKNSPTWCSRQGTKWEDHKTILLTLKVVCFTSSSFLFFILIDTAASQYSTVICTYVKYMNPKDKKQLGITATEPHWLSQQSKGISVLILFVSLSIMALKEKRQDELAEIAPGYQSYCKVVQAAIIICRQDIHYWNFPPANCSPVTLKSLNAPPGSPCPGVWLDQCPMNPRQLRSSS